ncbi:Plasmodium exported protein, unknown function [Plasmodium vinckei vinckei]|uniref:PIR protein CIR protein n=1 Tax=Plasmodium vinckei vinckei TaxID=54757 RepID=A0A081I957_PLAVN|nr:Plasmodium exported protein, unknown function [Plasmodium vinckei vinckei]KEG00215.1 hypothetical protein YYE_04942 [Plasmodium vinckei vinckei]VEV55129.1 Plasmodium exported protein, unknown function [Plasmodium vinckei vinckei]
MSLIVLVKPIIYALIICCEYYQNEVNKSEHMFKNHNAIITLSSRINRLLTECEAIPSTNPLSSHRRKEKEFNTESQKGDLEININENDIVNLENYVKENMNNNNMNDDDDDDNDEVKFEEEGYSANYRTYSKRDHLIGDHKKNPKYFLGINKKKMKKYMTNPNMQSGFVGPTAFGVGYPINQGLNPTNKFAAAEIFNYWLTGSAMVYIGNLIYNAFFKTRKVNI